MPAVKQAFSSFPTTRTVPSLLTVCVHLPLRSLTTAMTTTAMDKGQVLVVPALLFGSLVLYITLISPGWLASPSSLSSSSGASSPRLTDVLVAGQKSLALLQEQADGLLRLWNTVSNSTSAGPPAEDLKADIVSQIRLNQEAQQVLLSPYHQLNSSFLNGVPPLPVCKVKDVKQYSVKQGIPWKPKPGKFLFAVCTSGQFSNHLICIEKHMFIAALLGRALILPSPQMDYNYERVLDIPHIRNCLRNNKTVITFDDFTAEHHGHLHVNRFLCYMHGCYLDHEHEEKLKKLGVSWAKKEDVWPDEAHLKTPSHHASEIVDKFSCEDEIIGIGDMFYADVEADWVNQVGGPLKHTCRTLLQPHNYIVETAERFIQTYLGENFIALHFRRYGFLTFCNENSKKGYNCNFYPVPQAAACILRVVGSTSAPVIYLSTDAQESETGLLQSLLYQNGVRIPLVRRPDHDKGEKWDSPLQRHGLLGEKEVIAMLDKTICAMASTFIGSSGSTFSIDILRMRNEWASANTCDQYLCQGEKPNFVAGSH